MANLPAPFVSVIAALLAMLVVGLLVATDRSVAAGTHGWRHIRPGAMHWTGFCLSAAIALFMGYIWIFVGSTRPDGAAQMRILLWLILFFAGGSVLMGWAILQIRRAGIEWRGSVIACRQSDGARRKHGFEDVGGAKVTVVDTVGAGDTVGAILVEGIIKHSVNGLQGHALNAVLHRAAIAAGITVSRAGAQPPRLHELVEALDA